jgi:hypothetical protein
MVGAWVGLAGLMVFCGYCAWLAMHYDYKNLSPDMTIHIPLSSGEIAAFKAALRYYWTDDFETAARVITYACIRSVIDAHSRRENLSLPLRSGKQVY